MEYRDESQRLDQCSRLYDSSVSNDGFELDASRIVQVTFDINQIAFLFPFDFTSNNYWKVELTDNIFMGTEIYMGKCSSSVNFAH